jgi:hypothetical protein
MSTNQPVGGDTELLLLLSHAGTSVTEVRD